MVDVPGTAKSGHSPAHRTTSQCLKSSRYSSCLHPATASIWACYFSGCCFDAADLWLYCFGLSWVARRSYFHVYLPGIHFDCSYGSFTIPWLLEELGCPHHPSPARSTPGYWSVRFLFSCPDDYQLLSESAAGRHSHKRILLA